MKEFWSSVASILGVFAFCQGILQAVFPPQLRSAALKLSGRLLNWFSSYCYFDITEIDGVNTNELYNAAQLYLSSSAAASVAATDDAGGCCRRLSLTRAANSRAVTYGLANNDPLDDTFRGATVRWEHIVTPRQSQGFSWRPVPEEKRGFTLRVRKQDKPLILDAYLDYVVKTATQIRRRNQERLLYTNPRGGTMDSRGHPWEAVPFKHPSTFDTLAMDPERKNQIMADLRDFADGEAFYQKTGRAWKRGYLLYGPPGTGKSSMVAAMANFLGYDIYDLELTDVHNNSELRKLLMKTTSKSIIVIEDIDCSINLTNRNKSNAGASAAGGGSGSVIFGSPSSSSSSGDEAGGSITLSGLLNFTDGLWSCCGSERIFVFTTNHVEKLDPALLRSGRMDMHIHMSYCSFPALKILIGNYLGPVDQECWEVEDSIWEELEVAVEAVEMTPADVSEVLIKNRRDRGKAVAKLAAVMKERAGGKINRGSREGSSVEVVLEEQEKRALENPIKLDGSDDHEVLEKCKEGDESDDGGKKN